jgi:hypothetical protein
MRRQARKPKRISNSELRIQCNRPRTWAEVQERDRRERVYYDSGSHMGKHIFVLLISSLFFFPFLTHFLSSPSQGQISGTILILLCLPIWSACKGLKDDFNK